MGNELLNTNNQNNKLADFYLRFTVVSKNKNSNFTYVVNNNNKNQYIFKQINTNDDNQKRDLQLLIKTKINNPSKYLWKLQEYLSQKQKNYCSNQFKTYLLFQRPHKDLREQILERKTKNIKFQQRQIIQILITGINALKYLNDINQPHQQITTSNFYITNQGTIILSDPFLNSDVVTHKTSQVYNSPQKLDLINNINYKKYDWFSSDLFSLGMVGLQIHNLQYMSNLYKKNNKQINQQLVQQKIKAIPDPNLQNYIKKLLAQPNQRRQFIQSLFPNVNTAKIENNGILNKPVPTQTAKRMVSPIKLNNINAKNNNQQKKQQKSKKPSQIPQSNFNNHQNLSPTTKNIYRLPPQYLSPKAYTNPNLNLHPPQKVTNYNFNYTQPIEYKNQGTNILYNQNLKNYPLIPQNNLNSNMNMTNYQVNSSIDYLTTEKTLNNLWPQIKNVQSFTGSNPNLKNYLDELNKFNDAVSYNKQPYQADIKPKNQYNFHKKPGFDNNQFLFTDPKLLLDIKKITKQIENDFKPSDITREMPNQKLNNDMNSIKIDSEEESPPKIQYNNSKPINAQNYVLSYDNFIENKKKQIQKSEIKNISLSSINQTNNSIQQFNQQPHQILAPITPTRRNNPINKYISTIAEVSQSERTPSVNQPDIEFVIQEFAIGSRYQGFKKNKMRNGKGKFYYQDGGFYDGDWKDNKMHGYGKLYYNDTKIAYQGQWYMDEFHGHGKVYNDTPIPLMGQFNYKDFDELDQHWEYYVGSLAKDIKQGQGKLKISNGEIFEGQFKEDRIQGKGIFYTKSGQIINGIWKNSKLIKIL